MRDEADHKADSEAVEVGARRCRDAEGVRSLTEQLMHEQPSLHGEAEFWGLAWAALDYIERTVQPGMATLETGAGASTMMFASRGADHEAVTPSAGEAERIIAECERRGISTENLTFRIGSSADVLRDWEPRPLDFVLVDGASRLPVPDARLVVPRSRT